ncbi:F-box/LRR-repeat protein At4g14103-like isoform X2 [Lotus japonicus]|uniref:F-box/LRR-repeat protein At4g14103-like isoform X2 n=1 Tax=Lotus japonicus TaxID=34305 RepID=UPI0025878F5E|nr:F-box/LRR-repeat protein At4g14103-like isoform X2 [Lotus japonicus]XP_057425435.1 F-box/LRR-repeat protein At4g14103-like isoform X2 [Lotus japonicus]XP_057425437.1 F-box/LRR-repeat protein At4g14103-like isoform X2 [Lotus japonicus]
MSNSTDEMLILFNSTKRGRKSESEDEENKDRLNDIPDSILLHILSFLKAKYAVRTCILSTRWKDLWKLLPTLVLHEQDFSSDFVYWLLTLCDGSVALHGLDVKHLGFIHHYRLERIVKYAVSRNVQRLGLTVTCDNEHVLQCIFSCQTLTSLKLTVYAKSSFSENTLFPTSLNLPLLTSLHLGHFSFSANGNDRAEPFSSLNRLNSLIIQNCTLSDAHILYISSATLTNLTVHNHTRDSYSIELSSPNLSAFTFMGVPSQQLSGSNLSSLEQVNIDAEIRTVEDANIDLETSLNYPMCPFILLSWLVELANIKSLTISASTLQVLFLIPHLLELKLNSLSSLKSLKVKQII